MLICSIQREEGEISPRFRETKDETSANRKLIEQTSTQTKLLQKTEKRRKTP